MDWREYDEEAIRLEREFSDKVPLLTWEVARADSMAVIWRKSAIPDFCTYCIGASIMVNDRELWAGSEIDAQIVQGWEVENLMDYISSLIVHNMVQKIMEWKPDQPGGS